MAQGRYERRKSHRANRKRSGGWLIIMLASLLAVLALLLCRCDPGRQLLQETQPPTGTHAPVTTEATGPEDAPTDAPTDGATEEPTETEPTDRFTEPAVKPSWPYGSEPTTEPLAEPATEPTTEPTTEPATEPTTEPTTEPVTEPVTEPATEPTTEPTEYVVPYSAAADKAAGTALSLVGTAYEFGGSGPDTFDTTGLVFYCFRQNGVMAPRELSGQRTFGREVPKDQLQPGDVLFFWTSNPGSYEYVGIYIGNRQFVAARNPEHPTSIMNLDSEYFSQRYLSARRYYE